MTSVTLLTFAAVHAVFVNPPPATAVTMFFIVLLLRWPVLLHSLTLHHSLLYHLSCNVVRVLIHLLTCSSCNNNSQSYLYFTDSAQG